jgi:glucokinase
MNTNTNKNLSLVADIGGTNARFALVDNSNSTIFEARSLACADYPTLVDAIKAYLKLADDAKPHRAALSVATPVASDYLTMTNHSWGFSVNETRQALGWDSLKVLNDYTALALALPHLPDEECLQVGRGEKCEGYPKAAIGPGTGLGVSGLIAVGDHWYPLESEGGHVSYGPLSERESQIIEVVSKRLKHISVESLVSGPGISLLYEVIAGLGKGETKQLKPSQVTELALSGECAMAQEALSIFCSVFGTVAGNLALTLGARGGVYIGGGIIQKMTGFFIASDFRERFEQHGRLTGYLSQIPIYQVGSEYPALIGAMVSLNKEYQTVGIVSHVSS